MRIRPLLLAAASLSLVVLSAPPAHAGAGSVTVTGDAVVWTEASGESIGSSLRVFSNGSETSIQQLDGIIESPVCAVADNTAVCSLRQRVVVTFGALADTVDATGVTDGSRVEADGGPGGDHLVGSENADALRGGDGADELTGGPGADVIDCGPGTDTVHADPSDTLAGCEVVTGLPKVVAGYKVKVKDKTAKGWLVKKIRISKLLSGDAVSVGCQGGTCPFKTRQPAVSGGKVDLTKAFKGERRKKITLTITVERRGAIASTRTYRITRKGKISFADS